MNNDVIIVSGKILGKTADEPFGSEMLGKFLRVLESYDEKPKAICFYTDGVKVVLKNSEHLNVLRELEEQGVQLLVCKTCLNYFKVEDQVAVGKVGGMDEIVGIISSASKVVTV